MNAQELDARLTKRITSQSNSQLLEWLQMAFAGCMRYAEDYQHRKDTTALAELNLNLAVVNAVVDELGDREKTKHEEDR